MGSSDIATTALFLFGFFLTFSEKFREWLCELEIIKFAWGGLPLKQRMRFFQFIIGPGFMIMGGLFLYEALTLSM